MKENTVWILTYMLLVAAFAYVIGWVSGELVCRCKTAEEKLSELSQQREHSCSGTEQQRQLKELRSVLNDVHKHIVAVSKAVKMRDLIDPIGVGTAELGSDAKMLGVPNYDEAFVSLNRQLADNLKSALANRPEVLFTVQPNANHGAAAWSSRFPAAIKFFYPPSQ
jgi:hypothetical protein